MKNTIALLWVLSSFLSTAWASTTVEFELRGQQYLKAKNKFSDFKLSELNSKLSKKKLAGFPDRAVFNQNGAAYQALLLKRLEDANQALKLDVRSNIENAYFHELSNICYRGKASEVMGVINAIMGSVLEGDQGLQAYRYGKVKKILYPKSEFFETNPENRKFKESDGKAQQMKAWDDYDTKSATVLIMSDYGPEGDGTELTVTEIKPCE